jgi:beta-lactamase class A
MITVHFLNLLVCLAAPCQAEAGWKDALKESLTAIDRSHPGTLGVYVRRVSDGAELGFRAGRRWYLSSTTKVPVAVLVLRKVESGDLKLEQELVLKETDFVDGAGEIQGRKAGESLTIAYLLDKMLTQSDSTAADMLIRLVEDELEAFLAEEGQGFERITTLLDVRYLAFGELHPKASGLSNKDFFAIRQAGGTEDRVRAFASRIKVPRKELKAKSLEEAFERYYKTGLNSATLAGFGQLLERLVKGELLGREGTALILRHMANISTGERRIKAGLPEGTTFAQKTGTQIRRLCNVGVVNPGSGAVVIAACVEKYPDYRKAEGMLRKVGQALASSGLL